jgi:tetratricopeptide (TPR) repeat protein
MTLNNIANVHRRTGDFAEALRVIDRAIEMLETQKSPKVASAYGSKGQILHDACNDAEAVEWLRKSYTERQKQPSPDYALVLENLGYEITSLQRLGRIEEVAGAEVRISSVMNSMSAFPVPQVNVSSLAAEPIGAVFIELAYGGNPKARYSVRDAKAVAEYAYALIRAKGLAKNGRCVVIPESITLAYYGENAEAMYSVVKGYVSDHLIFGGAIVSIRQGESLRQVMVPTAQERVDALRRLNPPH